MSEKVLRYFYRSVKNLDGGVAEFCDVFQILPNGVSTAMLYSLTVTARQNGLNVEEYLTELLRTEQPIMPY